MSGNQSTLDVTSAAASSDYLPRRLTDEYDTSTAKRLMSAYGIDPTNIGVNADHLSEQEKGALNRYQYDKVYVYPRRVGPNRTEYEPIEFRTYIVTVGQPSERLKDFIDNVANPRLRTLFNTGPYQGYMSGFQFVESVPANIENDSIAVDEANNIGVPQFEVLITKGGRVQGQSTGFFYPFETVTDESSPEEPQQETWDINRQGDRYRIEPPGRTASRQRAERIRGKNVYVNDTLVGTMSKGGRAFLKNEYQNASQTYRGQHSREYLVTNTAATYSALRDGGNLYKVRETAEGVYLVTAAAKPDDFDPTPATDVDPTAVGRTVSIDFADATTFDIREDSGAMMGRYDTPVQRDITELTDFMIHA